MYPNLLDRFLTYAKINTRSDIRSKTTPTTESQKRFTLDVLLPEMEGIGLTDIHYIEDNGYLVGTLPATDPTMTRKIGFIAHVDTADYNAENIQPQVIENYDGKPILLAKTGAHLDPKDFPQLHNYLGDTLITTDGSTLLGADDKAGIAEILTAMEYLIAHPEIPHGEIRVGFGPDEEIGIGADKFDAADFDVDFAYTLDAGPLGQIQYETFNAASATLHFQGRNVHPGTAKNQMINALQMAIDFHNQLPEHDRPEKTDGYEGFYHLLTIDGVVDQAKAHYIIRDYDTVNFEQRKQFFKDLVAKMNQELGEERVILDMYDQYYNMRRVIEEDMTSFNLAVEVMTELGIAVDVAPIRGGTDGSKISFMGIPTPNLFAGWENAHGCYEFVRLQTMARAVDVIIGIVSHREA